MENKIIKSLGLDRNIILKTLKEENRRRLSNEYIQLCSEVASIPNEWLKVTDNLQTRLLEDFGFKDTFINNIAKNICDLFLMCKNVKLIIFDKNNQL